MKIAIIAATAAIAIMASTATGANAAILVTQSPDAIGLTSNFTATNTAQGQNFLFGFTVGATTLTGVDIYSDYISRGFNVAVGQPVIVKLTGDLGGLPDFANIVSYTTTISAIDSAMSTANPAVQRYHADFSQAVAAGTYWIGLGGNNNEIGLAQQAAGTGQAAWLLNGNSPGFNSGHSYTAAFNVYGGAVPEPASWALMIAGFGMVGVAARRSRKVVAA